MSDWCEIYFKLASYLNFTKETPPCTFLSIRCLIPIAPSTGKMKKKNILLKSLGAPNMKNPNFF